MCGGPPHTATVARGAAPPRPRSTLDHSPPRASRSSPAAAACSPDQPAATPPSERVTKSAHTWSDQKWICIP
eukprot:8326536-Pyramimonas_sp.AAC.1